MHNLANYVKQGLTLAHGSSLKTPDDTYLFFDWFNFIHRVNTFFHSDNYVLILHSI